MQPRILQSTRTAWLAALLLAAGLAGLLLYGRIPQNPAYHGLADRRTLLGIPNALDVLSNLAFLVVGWLGLRVSLRGGGRPGATSPFADPWERWPAVALFGGTLLTAFGSAWYHLAPSNARLVWDRLPMTLLFMGLLTALVADRLSLRLARRVFLPALLLGLGSVVYWRLTESRGAGDLRPYALVQFGSLLAVVLLTTLRPPAATARGRSGDTLWLLAALGAYVVAKIFESVDHQIFALTGVVSGHTLKHLAAAAAVWCLVARLAARVSRRA
jgi:hypothetical protein